MDGALTSGTIWHRGLVIAGRYRLERELAEGGMGSLWIAEHRGLGERVALKRVRHGGAHSTTALQQEARTLSRLRHPGIVRVLDVDRDHDGHVFLAMELLEGRDLAAILAHEGPLAPDAALRVLRPLADAIDFVHHRGVVHRDLKPANVIVGNDGAVHLVDFGLAMDLADDPGAPTPWTLLGTPEYMAPEQALGIGGRVRPASDRYAFAALALEVLTGHRPYPNVSITTLLLAIAEESPRTPGDLGWTAPLLDDAFARGLARDPDRRFASARELVDAIERSLASASCASRDAPDRTTAPTVRVVSRLAA